MKYSQTALGAALACVLSWQCCLAAASGKSSSAPSDGTVRVREFELPVSELLSAETRAELERQRKEGAVIGKGCPAARTIKEFIAANDCFNKSLEALSKHIQERYPVSIEPQKIAGVPVEVIAPAAGVAAQNRERVLINVHGGGFVTGARWGGQIESIPIAAVGKFKVMSVDYRQGPEHQFPAASEDVSAVYTELLKTYKPENIGIFGCSAGGLLTAQALAWFQKEGLPTPGAAGMFCAGASFWSAGDSGRFSAAQGEWPISEVLDPQANPYLKDIDPNDPLVFPARSAQVLAKFPPSLLIASSRDLALSSVVHTHSLLVAQGVEAQLHVWEGLGHAFFSLPDLPESRQAYDIMVRFFDRHLGKRSASAAGPAAPSLEEVLGAQVERFVTADQTSPPPPCQVLFVGSSSIVGWKTLAQDMAPLPVINRGFGGSQIEYVNRWFDQIVAPYRPRAIVFYAGENDVAAGKSVEEIVSDFDSFMARKTVALGQTPVYFISLKPSKLRFSQLEQQTLVNRAILERADRRSDLDYIDVVSPMLQDGKPKDLFVADDLHMAPAGYKIWTRLVRDALLPRARDHEQSCRRATT